MSQQPSAPVWLETPQHLLLSVIRNVESVIIGKRACIEKLLIAFLAGGHVLLEDVPGVGKTMLVRALAESLGASFRRVQFTPDLLPADVTGVSVYNPKTMEFEFRPGPIMANLILADEINRASPRTQSALLEAMEEDQVTVDGTTYPLPEPFQVLATQNPAEFDGTFPLPEAQMDRFAMKVRIGYPEREHESLMLDRMQGKHPIASVSAVLTGRELLDMRKQAADVYVDESIKRYIVNLAAATREHPEIRLGASPRASIMLMKTAQARAWLSGRTYVIPDDIKALAHDVLDHRLVPRGFDRSDAPAAHRAVEQILGRCEVPNWSGRGPDSPAKGKAR